MSKVDKSIWRLFVAQSLRNRRMNLQDLTFCKICAAACMRRLGCSMHECIIFHSSPPARIGLVGFYLLL